MKKSQIIIYFLLIINILISGCTRYYAKNIINKYEQIVNNCQNEWIYSDLNAETTIKVLLFEAKRNFDLNSHPAFIIGNTKSNEIIAILDKDFDKILEVGDSIKVTRTELSNDDKTTLKPLYVIYGDSKKNDLLCKVKIVYYGKIECIIYK